MTTESMTIDQVAANLYRRGQLMRDSWWNSYVAKLEAMIDRYHAAETALGDFERILEQLPEAPADPFATPPVHGPDAPPLPGGQPQPMDDFMADHIRRHGPPPGGQQ